jgi:hypothetical protein
MENTIKYYNNRPVYVLRKHETADFYEVLVNLEIQNIDLDYIAETYRGCDSCMVGHKSECHCTSKVSEAYDLLERIVEEHKINEENIFFVKSKDLKEKPFEWSENEKLKAEITTKKNVLNGVIDIVAEQKSLIKEQEKKIKTNNEELLKLDRIVENRKALTEIVIKDYEKLQEDVKKLESRKKLIIIDAEVQINYSEYQELLKRDELLTALEQGGVDNWEWYDEAVKNLKL